MAIEENKQSTYRIRAYRVSDMSPYSNEAASGTTPAWHEMRTNYE